MDERTKFARAAQQFAELCGVGTQTIVASLMIAAEMMENSNLYQLEYGQQVQRELKSISKRFLEEEGD